MTDDERLIAGYVLRYTHPIHWVKWWGDTNDSTAKNRLYSVLFDASTESLKDLTTQAIRAELLGVVLANETLRQTVLKEAREFVDAVADGVSREDASRLRRRTNPEP
jgi:hypothetical protein